MAASQGSWLGAPLAAALLASSAFVAAPAAAQSNLPVPPAGGYRQADGTRTTDYAAALDSWRRDAQFAVDYTKANIGLEYAYVLGLDGAGQTIGINDSGVLFEHPLFGGAGKIGGIRSVAPAGYGNDGRVNPRRPWEIHGTHVAGTAAGARIAGQRMFGNAYGASILAASINFAAGDFLWWKDQILDGTTVSTPQENIVALADTGKVRIINNSWGSGTSAPFDLTLAQAQAQFRQTLNGFYDPVLKNDVLVVFSAGNGGGVHASIDAVTPLGDMRLRSNWLSVANYTASGTAAPGTSFCGQTATWCVAGPGSAVISSVNTYTVDTAAIQGRYTRAMYPGIYSATTLAALQDAATDAWLTVLNGYLNRRAAGTPFDEAAERTAAAQQAVGISLAYGARFVGGDPDGYTGTLADMLTVPGNVAILGRDFAAAVLTQANAIITAELQRFIRYSGPGYGALTGTSMAAPNVSGFAALLMQAFPEYGTGLIADILVSSSKDLDTPGVDLRSGWGAPQMGVALAGPTALRQTREVTVAAGTVDIWTNGITDARDRYSAEVLAGFGNDIGGLTKRGGGELILAGASSYSGPTRVEEGRLTVNGQLTRSALTAAGNGTIGGNGTLASLAASAGGIVAPGSANAIGTLNVSGTTILAAGSQLLIDIGASGRSDRLATAGSATLGGTLTLRPVDRLPRFGDSYTVLTAGGGVIGSFADATAFSAILFPELRYGGTSVSATVAARPYAGIVANTPVQASYARLLDGNRAAHAVLGGTYDALDLQSAGTIRASLEALAPRAETARRAIGTVALDNMARFYRERTAAMRPGDFAGGSIAMIGKPLEFAATAAVAPGQAMHVGDTPVATVRENALPENVSAYLAGGYLKGSGTAMPGTVPQGGRDPFDGYYIAGGVEARVSDTAMLGFGLSYSDIDGERRFGQAATGDLIEGTLYGRLGDTTGAAIDGQFSAGVFQSTTRRTGRFAVGSYDLTGRDDALALSTEIGAGYAVGSEALRLYPRVAMRAGRIDFTPIAERGTGPALLTAEDRLLSVQGRAGLHFDGSANGLRPFGSAYFVHDFEERPGVFQAGLVGGTGVVAPFAVAGQDRNWGEIGAGIAYGDERFEFLIAADASVGRDDVRHQSYRAGVKVRF